MNNPLYKLYNHYSYFWECHVPSKPKYGNYYGRGWTSRWRKFIKQSQ